MKARCYLKSYRFYHHYGGRGIRICKEWLEDFDAFYSWSMENGFRPDLEIDRINNEGDYSPDNCRWVTRRENLRNRRHHVMYEGRPLIQVLHEHGLHEGDGRYSGVRYLIEKKGWSLEDALSARKVGRVWKKAL